MDGYDDFPYDELPHAVTHPDRLGAIGRLAGMAPAPATGCRVLELGCAVGGNLLPLADLLPGSEFVGIDRSAAQIARARADAEAIGLTNVRFEALDVRELPADWGRFDYVVCHGLYSWVPDDVRAAVLAAFRAHLAPQGLAFLSFNALPGWHARGLLRHLLRRVVAPGPAPRMVAEARRFLGELRAHAKVGMLEGWLERELVVIESLSDAYLYFEHLVEDNDAFTLTEVVTRARDAGLELLADADVTAPPATQLGAEAQAVLTARCPDALAEEQLLDDLTFRCFRRILLCNAEVAPDPVEDGAGLAGAWLSTDLVPEAPDGGDVDTAAGPPATVRGADARVLTVADPVTGALLAELAAARPAPLPADELPAHVARRLRRDQTPGQRREVLDAALDLVRRGQVEVGWWPRPVATTLPERPVATRLARHQAARDRGGISTLWHERFAADTLERVLLGALDGRHDAAALLPVVRAAQASGRLVMTMDDVEVTDREVLEELIALKLERLWREGLILAPEAGAPHRA